VDDGPGRGGLMWRTHVALRVADSVVRRAAPDAQLSLTRLTKWGRAAQMPLTANGWFPADVMSQARSHVKLHFEVNIDKCFYLSEIIPNLSVHHETRSRSRPIAQSRSRQHNSFLSRRRRMLVSLDIENHGKAPRWNRKMLLHEDRAWSRC
jgi:hypothetical protein